MEISQNGIDLIKSFEVLKLTAYRLDGEQYYTIGYGHYGADVYAGMTITEAQAEELLKQDLAWAVEGTNNVAVAKFPNLNQNQFDALCSYTFNRGVGASTNKNGLRQLIYNSSTLEEVANNFIVYWGTAEQHKEGLLNRRRKEQALFNTPVEEETNENAIIIEKAIKWAVGIANDDKHGYDQANRWGNDYDCSSLLIQAYENAGCPVKTNGATYTGNMESVFTATGFESLSYSQNMELLAGDVLLRSGHTAMYIGNGNIVSAHINELGTTTGGVTGDQTTHEIDVSSFATSGEWVTVLRLPVTGGSVTPEPDTPNKPTFERKKLSKLLLFALLTDRF